MFQLKQAGVISEQSLPHKDLIFLRKAFVNQLQELHYDYLKTGRKTFIIIDGLDHIPRQNINQWRKVFSRSTTT